MDASIFHSFARLKEDENDTISLLFSLLSVVRFFRKDFIHVIPSTGKGTRAGRVRHHPRARRSRCDRDRPSARAKDR